MAFFRVSDLPQTEMLEGVFRSAVYLENAMITFFSFDAGAIIPEHQHPHEQITLILEGAMEFTLGDETRVIEAGEGVTIPPNVSHGGRILSEPTKAIDAWHPIREDYK
jgi:quercetin dioxygenase-like cupin family protein